MKDFLKSIKSTLTVAQVVEGVKANARLTFDYISLVMLARYLLYFIYTIKTLCLFLFKIFQLQSSKKRRFSIFILLCER